MPLVAPLAMLQTPPQQSAPVVHTSPFCSQKPEGSQRPPAQRPEQQSVATLQMSPRIPPHPVASGVQVPAVPQAPLQHSAPVVHAMVSETHGGGEQTPTKQTPPQQSIDVEHAPPSFKQPGASVVAESVLPESEPPVSFPPEPSFPDPSLPPVPSFPPCPS
jgi:hypothetical protein